VTKRVQLDEEADAELEAAKAWYEEQRPGLGDEFLDAVTDALTLLELGDRARQATPRLLAPPDELKCYFTASSVSLS